MKIARVLLDRVFFRLAEMPKDRFLLPFSV